MSAARPRIADYPFTTLYPHLGVVSVSAFRSFVIADLPGLIEGAAEGAGLGIRFLKHVSRTHLLFHVVDVMPPDDSDPAEQVKAIAYELEKFDSELIAKERWLVLNKIDLLPPDEVDSHCQQIVDRLGWTGRVFKVSGVANFGLTELAQAAMRALSQDEEEF
jgi:GTPase